MVTENRERLRAAVIATAELANRTLSDAAVRLYVHELASLPIDAVCAALVAGARAQRLPSVEEIEASVTGKVGPQGEAQEVADRIGAAIKNIGSYRSQDAKEAIGELGWEVVRQCGGWQAVCSVESEKDLAIAKAGWRETAKWVATKAKAGALGQKPALPMPPPSSGLRSAADLVKGILPPARNGLPDAIKDGK